MQLWFFEAARQPLNTKRAEPPRLAIPSWVIAVKVAFNTYVSLGAFGEAWNGKPVSGGVPGDIPSMDLSKLDYDHTGLVYRNEIIAHIRDLKVISAETGARLDGRLTIG